MQKHCPLLLTALVGAFSLHAQAQEAPPDPPGKNWFVGSSLLMLGNLIPSDPNPPEYIQLNAGYQLTANDVVQFRFKRSVYAWPLGIPFGPSFDAPGLGFPGRARIIAPQLGYQRFWWKGAYTALYALNAFEKYTDANKNKVGTGYTLYLDFYAGYQFNFFNRRVFFEPAIGCSYWPIRTGVPQAFKAAEQQWPNYFIQPGFDFGVRF